MSSLPDLAPFPRGLALNVNAMQPYLPPSEHEPIYREGSVRAEYGD